MNKNKNMKILEESKNKENSNINKNKNEENEVQYQKDNIKKINNIKKNDNNNNKIPKGYIDHLNLNCFNRFYFRKDAEKRKTVQLFNLSSIFYRKRMDIVISFSRSFLIEKLLLKDNLNKSYSFCNEIELI